MTNGKFLIHAGWALTALAVVFLLMDAGMKLAAAKVAIDASGALGFQEDQVRILGLVLLAATALYAIPQTAPIGAILITAFLGGAVAVHLQHRSPLFTHTLFGVYLGIIVWGGLLLRQPSIRVFWPFLPRP